MNLTDWPHLCDQPTIPAPMSQAVANSPDITPEPAVLPFPPAEKSLLKELLFLALPVLAEHALHIVVGLNDTYLANHLPQYKAESAAAVGNVGYIFWFMGLFAGAIATGSTAIIAREIGARHRRRANSACGQSMLFAAAVGLVLGLLLSLGAGGVSNFMGLSGKAHEYSHAYLRM